MIEMAKKIEAVEKHKRHTNELKSINKALKAEYGSDKYSAFRP